MFLITFSKAGQEDIVLTEDDLFDFQYEASCYSGETFELGGVNAKTLYLLIDNNTQRFSRGTFANCRVKLEIDGKFFGYYNTELPKRRNGVIELTAYDDMVKLDTEFPTDYTFPQTFWAVYAQCVFEAGLASEVSFDNVVLNGVWDNGIISADYTQYIYANSCRNLVAGMAEWNGGFAYINDDNKLQIGNVSKIAISGNCSMTVTCGGFENVSSSSGFTPTSYSQIQQSKQEAKGDGTAEKLQTTGSKYWAVTDDSGVSFGADDSGKIAFLTKQGTGTGFRLGAYGNTGIEFEGSGHGAIKLYDNCGGTCSLVVDNCAEYPIFICTSDDSGQIDHTSLQVYNGGKLKVYPDSLAIQTESRTTLTLKITSDGWSLGMTGKKLEAKSDGLYFNGKKVLLEG